MYAIRSYYGKSQADDRIIIDFKGTIDGEPFEGGEGQDVAVLVGAGQVIESLQALGYRNLQIVESAWVGDSTEEGFRVNGYYEISKKYQVPLVDVKDDDYQILREEGIAMEVSKTIMECDFP